MAESSTSETQTQSGATAAKQMLAALTKHSQEITKRFSESCEFVNRLNSTLENKVDGRLSDINETAENIVRVQLENLSAEKDSVLAELTELRQEELKVLQTIGKDLRDALSERLKELIDKVKSELDEKLSSFQEGISQTENEVSLAVENLRKTLDEKLPDLLATIKNNAAEAKAELESTQAKQKEMLSQETSLSLDTMAMHCDELKGKLEKQGTEYLQSIDALVESLLSEQNSKLKERVQALSSLQEQAAVQLKTEEANAEKLLETFGASCQQIAELRVNLHSSMANNLALIYRTELLSIAQETEDQLIIVRSHLHSVLRNYHDMYSEQSNNLLAKFEKSAKEALPSKSAAELSEENLEVPEEVQELFKNLRIEINDQVKEIISKTDVKMEESLAEFRTQLTEHSQRMCGEAENKFNEFRKEISDTVESNKAMMEEMSQKTAALEQLIEESNELISALDQSNLEF